MDENKEFNSTQSGVDQSLRFPGEVKGDTSTFYNVETGKTELRQNSGGFEPHNRRALSLYERVHGEKITNQSK